MKSLLLLFSLALSLSPLAEAQTVAPSAQPALRQEIFLDGGVAITRKVSDAGLVYAPETVAGLSAGYRYNLLRWLGAEASYSYLPDTQRFTRSAATTVLDADVHVATASAVVQFSNPLAKSIKSFLTVGGGTLLFVPRNNSALEVEKRNTIQVGGGEDIGLSRHLLLRVQVASFTYQAPDFALTALHTGKYAQTVLPSAGLVFRF